MNFIPILLVALLAVFARFIYVTYDQFMISELSLEAYITSAISHRIITKLYPANSTESMLYARQTLAQLVVYGNYKTYLNITNIYIPRVDEQDQSSLMLRLYQPRNYTHTDNDDDSLHPVVLWLHGGGFVLGSVEGIDELCHQLSDLTNAIVVNVDYRLAPEYTYPAGLNDVHTALKWVHDNIHQYGGDRTKIVVGGDSAGGNLAAAVTVSLYFYYTYHHISIYTSYY